MRPVLALPLLAVCLSSCADSPPAMSREQWEMRDDPAAVRAAQVEQARENALDEVQGDEDRLQRLQGISQDDRNRREQDLEQRKTDIQSGNWSPDSFQ